MTTITVSPLEINRAYYETHAEDFCQKTAELSLNEIHNQFLTLLPPDAHILDAGCGSGRDGLAFMRCGFRVLGIDASPTMVKIAMRRGLKTKLMSFQEMEFIEKFDAIWACASLLHIPHAEIPEVLRRFARALKPNGVLYASLKAGHGERVAEDGRFFSYFSLEEFAETLMHEGLFELIKTWQSNNPDSSGTVRPWLNFLARRSV